jgi:outer membrane protein OmpA-like peptidoglycan-associated protein
MRILPIGFIAFFTWSAFSTHYYVCKIKHLCNERETIQNVTFNRDSVIVSEPVSKSELQSQALVPGSMIVNFEFDQSEFIPDTVTDKYFDKSKAYLDQNIAAKLSITGHTDAVGTDEYNQALGIRRAQSLQNYFERKGIINRKIIAESKGEKDPADDNNTISGRANNRRTVIIINK